MIINDNTSLALLAVNPSITTRAINVCQNNGIFTIGDLMKTPDDEILKIHNCGRKTLDILIKLKKDYANNTLTGIVTSDNQPSLFDFDNREEHTTSLNEMLSAILEELPDAVGKKAADRFMATDDSVRNIAENIFEHPREFVKICISNIDDLPDIYKAYCYVMDKWLQHPELSNLHRGILQNRDKLIRHTLHNSVTFQSYHALPCCFKDHLEHTYQNMVGALSRRSINIMNKFPTVLSVLKLIYGLDRIDLMNIDNCGRKSTLEIDALIARFKETYEKIVRDANDSDSEKLKNQIEELSCRIMARKYPWLSEDDCKNYVQFYVDGLTPPTIFLIRRYLSTTDTRDVFVFNHHSGFDPSFKFMSLDEMAIELGLTRERVRQIYSAGLTLPPMFDEFVDEIHKMLDSRDFIASDDPCWNQIKAKHDDKNNPISRKQLMTLITSLLDGHDLVIIENDAPIFIVRREIFSQVRLMSLIREIRRQIACRRIAPVKLPLRQVIDNEIAGPLTDAQRHVVYDMVMQYITALPDIKVADDEYTIIAPQNKINILKDLADIIRANGKPMDFDSLYNAFREKHPDFESFSRSSLRSYIQRSDDVTPIGKTGSYAVAEWEHQFTGTINELIRQLLSERSTPIHFNELYAMVKAQIPRTNYNSTYSMMAYHGRETFVVFEGNYAGLRGRDYGPEWIEHTSINDNCQLFEIRLTNFEKFVQENSRFPFTKCGPREESLVRWMRNVQNGRIKATSPELERRFDKLMNSPADVPKTINEYRFKTMSEQIINYVRQHKALPKAAGDKTLYYWLRRMFANIDNPSPRIRNFARTTLRTIADLVPPTN